MFVESSPAGPAELFRRLKERNPSPYGFVINLGEGEYLVGASPEMYVRVDEDRVETCPISGTIARGGDPISDAAQILALLNSEKDESELTMCTDVDRNDKSRICRPGSVQVIGRRQIEMYSRLIHTVDHVEGRLRDGFDCLDAFLTHTWAVTVTGAPKLAAMEFIEAHERSPRAWYGGADRHGLLRREHEHRPDPAHDPGEGRHGAGPGGGHAPLRLGAGGRGGGDRAEGVGLPRRRAQPLAGARAGRAAAAASGPPAGRCWSTTATASSTRSPTTSAASAPR